MNIQLLCTFCKLNDIEDYVNLINKKYNIFSNKIFILENLDDNKQFILTYNVDNIDMNDILNSTILVHRKKQTNTIYTINALNILIMGKNNGVLDKNYKIDWEDYKNTILVTAFGNLKQINTKLHKIIEVGT